MWKSCLIRVPSVARTRILRRNIDSSSVTSVIQWSMQGLHDITHLPWWLTYSVSTLIVRISMLPLIRLQMLHSRKLAEKAMPDINLLFKLYQQNMQNLPIGNNAENIKVKMKLTRTLVNGVNSCLVLHDISRLKFIAYPLANLSIFATFVYSLRDMVNEGAYATALETGGFAWFSDLTARDSTLLLPFMAVGMSYLSLRLAFGPHIKNGKFALLVMDFFQSIIIISLPFITPLANGVFCYWIPSSVIGIAQIYLLKNPFVIKLLRLPPPLAPQK